MDDVWRGIRRLELVAAEDSYFCKSGFYRIIDRHQRYRSGCATSNMFRPVRINHEIGVTRLICYIAWYFYKSLCHTSCLVSSLMRACVLRIRYWAPSTLFCSALIRLMRNWWMALCSFFTASKQLSWFPHRVACCISSSHFGQDWNYGSKTKRRYWQRMSSILWSVECLFVK